MKKLNVSLLVLLIGVVSLFVAAPISAEGVPTGEAGFNIDCFGAHGYGVVPNGTTVEYRVRYFDPNNGIDQVWQARVTGDIDTAFSVEIAWPTTPTNGTTASDTYFWWEIWVPSSGGLIGVGEGHFDNFDCHTPPPPPPSGGEGCTPGYWKQKQHLDSWVDYNTTDLYATVFGVSPSFGNDVTLLQALGQGGGGEKALGRHATAALLNAASSVDYLYSEADIISMVQAAYNGGDVEGTKNLFAEQNEMGCPLN